MGAWKISKNLAIGEEDIYKVLRIAFLRKEGDKILDTHLGSGSIAIACHNLGYDLDGFEIDKDYYNDALKRFKNHTSQIRLYE